MGLVGDHGREIVERIVRGGLGWPGDVIENRLLGIEMEHGCRGWTWLAGEWDGLHGRAAGTAAPVAGDGQGYDAERRERAEALEPLFAKGIGVEVVGDDMPEQAADGGAKDLQDA